MKYQISLLALALAALCSAQQPLTEAQILGASGNGRYMVTTTGPQTAGNCVSIDNKGNHVASGSGCGSGGGTGGASLTAPNIWTTPGTASTPSQLFTGAPYTAGDANTTGCLYMLEPATGRTPGNSFNTAGCEFGINMPHSFAGDFLELLYAGTTRLNVTITDNQTFIKDPSCCSGQASIDFANYGAGIAINGQQGTSIVVRSGFINMITSFSDAYHFQNDQLVTINKKYGCTAGGTCGVATLASGSATVSTTYIAALALAGGAGDVVQLSLQTCTACGILNVGTVVPGTSFVIHSSNAADASNVYWEIKHVN